MRSVFVNSAFFRRFDLGTHILSGGRAPQMGFSFKDLLPAVGLTPADIAKVEDPAVRADFKTAYERCQTMGLDSTKGIVCLAELGAKVYAAISAQGKAPITPVTPIAPASSTGSLPIIPIAIAVIAAGGLVWFLATKGKK
jgi:hypothetical protein